MRDINSLAFNLYAQMQRTMRWTQLFRITENIIRKHLPVTICHSPFSFTSFHLPFTIWTLVNDIITQPASDPDRLSICCVHIQWDPFTFPWDQIPEMWGPKSWLTKICGALFAIFVSAIHCEPFLAIVVVGAVCVLSYPVGHEIKVTPEGPETCPGPGEKGSNQGPYGEKGSAQMAYALCV